MRLPRGGVFSSVGQRVARSLPERWPAVLPRGERYSAVQGHQLAYREGQPGRCPFLVGNKREAAMDAKTRNLALLASLSLFCAGVALISDHLILGSVFFAPGEWPPSR
jgi:hypothetical protein